MQRRHFLKLSAALGAAGALPLWSRSLMAASRPPLPIPALLEADAKGQYSLTAMEGTTQWQGKAVPTWGYNGSLLGPAIRLKRGRRPPLTSITGSGRRRRCTGTAWKSPARSTAAHRALLRRARCVRLRSPRISQRQPAGIIPICMAKPVIRSHKGWRG